MGQTAVTLARTCHACRAPNSLNSRYPNRSNLARARFTVSRDTWINLAMRRRPTFTLGPRRHAAKIRKIRTSPWESRASVAITHGTIPKVASYRGPLFLPSGPPGRPRKEVLHGKFVAASANLLLPILPVRGGPLVEIVRRLPYRLPVDRRLARAVLRRVSRSALPTDRLRLLPLHQQVHGVAILPRR